MSSKLFIACLLIACFTQLQAQKKKSDATAKKQQDVPPSYTGSIRVLAQPHGDSVILRWGPSNEWAWNRLNKVGYIIERIDITESQNPKKELLTAQPLKPMTPDEMKRAFTIRNKYAAIEAQSLYGTNFETGIRKGAGGIEDKANTGTNRFSFAMMVADFDADVAKAAALRLTDKKVKRGGVYFYRIYPGAPPKDGKIDTATIMVVNDPQVNKQKPSLKEVVALDRVAELHWERSPENQFSGFFIERSTDGRNFKQLNELPYFSSRPDTAIEAMDSVRRRINTLLGNNHVFIDSLPSNYTKYYYRIRGVNAFAQWSDYSDVLTAMGKDLTPPAAPIVESPVYEKSKGILLKWKKPFKEGDFKGYMVTRSHNAVMGPYATLTSKLLEPSVTQFTDTGAFAHGQNYYIVLAVDTAGNIAYSVPVMALVPDNTPPIVPTGLKGFITKDGLVHLSWKPNPDEDIKGYKVYFSNSSNDMYSQITLEPVADTVFTDSITLKTLSKNIWYKIVAVDQNNNHSKYSEPVRLKKPDIVPPMPPLATKVHVDTAGVQIDWINSPSDDVVAYLIYRKDKNTSWSVISRMKHDASRSAFHFTDNNVKPFTDYEYSAEAIDEDSLHSVKSASVNATVKTVPDLPPLKTLTASYDAKLKQVHLKWQFTDQGNYFFVLYRSEGSEPLMKYQSAGPAVQKFDDNVSAFKGKVSYAIQVIYRDQRGRTRVSDPVSVMITTPGR